MNAVRSLFRNPPLLTFVLVALVWLVAGLTLRGFGAYGHLRYLLELAAVIGIAAAGQTLVILMGGIDLSVGAVITVTAILLPLISPPGTRRASSASPLRWRLPPASASSTARERRICACRRSS